MVRETVPKINSRVICIVDRQAKELAAVISSYLFQPGCYTPFFLFGRAAVSRTEDAPFMSEGYVAYLMVDHTSVLIHNAVARMGGSEYVILAGLNEQQKTYLDFSDTQKIIEIAEVSEIDSKLTPLLPPKKGRLRCRKADILSGLCLAQQQDRTLVIDDTADELATAFPGQTDGMVLIENVDEVASVIAVNYANSVSANVLISEPLATNEGRDIQKRIQNWKEAGDQSDFERIRDAVLRRIGSHSLQGFRYVTFFTEGLPYSLIVENAVPSTQVHLAVRPDFFVLNNLMFSAGERFGSAVVFSPVFFEDEETNWLCESFPRHGYVLKALVGRNSTVANFDFYAQHWPYDLFHICSHGGEVEGYEMSEVFFDSSGTKHTVDFEEVVGVTPVFDDPNRVTVHRKMFPRRLDGCAWMSTELSQKRLAGDVIREMWKAIMECEGRRKKVGKIALSCAVACSDSIHQGQFNSVASHSSPVIFNNSCWSWHEVALSFLDCGARAYIGTLWTIENSAAVAASEAFYRHIFDGTVLNALGQALKAVEGTRSQNIYILWGLHFSSLPSAGEVRANVANVTKNLVWSVDAWIRKIKTTKSHEIRRNSIRVLQSMLREIAVNFSAPDALRFVERVKRAAPEVFVIDTSREVEGRDWPESDQGGREFPVEYRNKP